MNMLGSVLSLGSIISFIALMVIFQMTNPSEIGPVGILIVFMLLYCVFLGLITLSIMLVRHLVNRFNVIGRKQRGDIKLSRAYYFASVIALAPVMIIGMQSVGVVGVYELLLVGFFVVVGCMYVSRRT